MILGRYTVSLTRVSDGKNVTWTEPFEIHDNSVHLWPGLKDWEGTVEFLWSEGNYSCNCNRFLFFERAQGKTEEEIKAIDPDKDDMTGSCGLYENYRVEWIRNADTQQVIYGGDEGKYVE